MNGIKKVAICLLISSSALIIQEEVLSTQKTENTNDSNFSAIKIWANVIYRNSLQTNFPNQTLAKSADLKEALAVNDGSGNKHKVFGSLDDQ